MNIEGVKLRIEYFLLGLRDKLGMPFKPEEEIKKINLKAGQTVLDYGCGIGSCTIPAAKLVGKEGKVYALDKQTLALKRVEEKAKRNKLDNIETILCDKDIELPGEKVDVILLYGVLPEVEDKESLLKEVHRVLKPSGCLSTRYCFRIKKEKVVEIVEETNLFSLIEEKGHILNFRKKK